MRLFMWHHHEERMDSDDHEEETVLESRDVTYDKSLPTRHDVSLIVRCHCMIRLLYRIKMHKQVKWFYCT